MTRPEFLGIIGYLCAGFRTDMTPQTIEVYYDLLGGLPVGIFQAAVKRVLRERLFPTLPTVAELLKAAHCYNTFGRTPLALSDIPQVDKRVNEITVEFDLSSSRRLTLKGETSGKKDSAGNGTTVDPGDRRGRRALPKAP